MTRTISLTWLLLLKLVSIETAEIDEARHGPLLRAGLVLLCHSPLFARCWLLSRGRLAL